MTDLPEIDYKKVAHKLAAKNTEALLQIAQLEVLAEALRDERNSAQAELEKLKAEK